MSVIMIKKLDNFFFFLKLFNYIRLIFKLFIAPELLEAKYLKCNFISEIWVTGDSLQSSLVAIVVPNQELLIKYSQERGWHGTFEQLCERKEVNAFILKEMDKTADQVNLLGFERVKSIYLEHVSMVVNGVCTPSLKIKRKEAKIFYGSVVKQLYKDINKN